MEEPFNVVNIKKKEYKEKRDMETMAVVALAVFNDWWHVGIKAGEGIKDDPKISK